MTHDTASLDNWITVLREPAKRSPALFLDRDGTLIENIPYLADPQQVVLHHRVADVLHAFKRCGHAVIVVTNQSGVARGLVEPGQYQSVNRRMIDLLGEGMIDAIFACPFHQDGQAPYRVHHPWRKPAAGMLFAAQRRFGLNLAGSTMVGDSLADVQAGLAARVGRLVHLATGHGVRERPLVEQLISGSSGTCFELLNEIADLRPMGRAA